ncbi:putative signal peptide protein [Puccinia sorghi]|uniref:Putative signal peptide protein n=1 Tax=Puccinia sorghi TaxID=27349 RepID=A0A0L6UYD6_9BASI|nr:putative signal peptide protein [Puccinia sorghi]
MSDYFVQVVISLIINYFCLLELDRGVCATSSCLLAAFEATKKYIKQIPLNVFAICIHLRPAKTFEPSAQNSLNIPDKRQFPLSSGIHIICGLPIVICPSHFTICDPPNPDPDVGLTPTKKKYLVFCLEKPLELLLLVIHPNLFFGPPPYCLSCSSSAFSTNPHHVFPFFWLCMDTQSQTADEDLMYVHFIHPIKIHINKPSPSPTGTLPLLPCPLLACPQLLAEPSMLLKVLQEDLSPTIFDFTLRTPKYQTPDLQHPPIHPHHLSSSTNLSKLTRPFKTTATKIHPQVTMAIFARKCLEGVSSCYYLSCSFCLLLSQKLIGLFFILIKIIRKQPRKRSIIFQKREEKNIIEEKVQKTQNNGEKRITQEKSPMKLLL